MGGREGREEGRVKRFPNSKFRNVSTAVANGS